MVIMMKSSKWDIDPNAFQHGGQLYTFAYKCFLGKIASAAVILMPNMSETEMFGIIFFLAAIITLIFAPSVKNTFLWYYIVIKYLVIWFNYFATNS